MSSCLKIVEHVMAIAKTIGNIFPSLRDCTRDWDELFMKKQIIVVSETKKKVRRAFATISLFLEQNKQNTIVTVPT
eukprot:726727-Amphidinium_carterae.1